MARKSKRNRKNGKKSSNFSNNTKTDQGILMDLLHTVQMPTHQETNKESKKRASIHRRSLVSIKRKQRRSFNARTKDKIVRSHMLLKNKPTETTHTSQNQNDDCIILEDTAEVIVIDDDDNGNNIITSATSKRTKRRTKRISLKNQSIENQKQNRSLSGDRTVIFSSMIPGTSQSSPKSYKKIKDDRNGNDNENITPNNPRHTLEDGEIVSGDESTLIANDNNMISKRIQDILNGNDDVDEKTDLFVEDLTTPSHVKRNEVPLYNVSSSALNGSISSLLSLDDVVLVSSTPIIHAKKERVKQSVDDSVIFVSEEIIAPKIITADYLSLEVNAPSTKEKLHRRVNQLRDSGEPLAKKSKQSQVTPKNHKSTKNANLFTSSERKKNAIYNSNTYNPNKEEPSPGKRMVIIDGSNVAYGHSCGKGFSVKGVEIAIKYFLKMGHEVKAVVPQYRLKKSMSTEPEVLETLHREGKIVFTPCKQLPGKSSSSYDDRFILQLAVEFDAAIVSNDNYRDLLNENPAFKKIIESRVIGYTWCNDLFMLPKDPYGRSGPNLSVILNRV